MVINYKDGSDAELSYTSESYDNDYVSIDKRNYNCGLEIKTPSSKMAIQWCIRQYKYNDHHGAFLQCDYVSLACRQLVHINLNTWHTSYTMQPLKNGITSILLLLLLDELESTMQH